MPAPFLVPLAIAAGQTLFQGISNAISAKRERKFARENWDMQNEYNTPAAQMQRYRDAGVHPGYGSANFSSNAAPMGDAASTVSRVEIPNVLEAFQSYFATKNAALENSRLSELVTQARLQTDYLQQTMLDRVGLQKAQHEVTSWRVPQEKYRRDLMHFETQNKKQLFDRGFNPDLMKYQLDGMRFNNEKQLFDLDYQLKNLELGRQKVGLTSSDNVFLRMLQRMNQGTSPMNSLFNYFK